MIIVINRLNVIVSHDHTSILTSVSMHKMHFFSFSYGTRMKFCLGKFAFGMSGMPNIFGMSLLHKCNLENNLNFKGCLIYCNLDKQINSYLLYSPNRQIYESI